MKFADLGKETPSVKKKISPTYPKTTQTSVKPVPPKKKTSKRATPSLKKHDLITMLITKGRESPLPEYQYISQVLQKKGKNPQFQRKKILDALDMVLDYFTVLD